MRPRSTGVNADDDDHRDGPYGPEGDKLTWVLRRHSSTFSTAAACRQDPGEGPHSGSRRQELRSAEAHRSEKQGVADPRASRRVDRDGGGGVHAGQPCSTQTGSRSYNSGVPRRARTRRSGVTHARPTPRPVPRPDSATARRYLARRSVSPTAVRRWGPFPPGLGYAREDDVAQQARRS